MTVRALAKLPLVPVPSGWRFQPVDSGEVASRLVELSLGAPAGLVPDMGGPRIYDMVDLARSYLDTTGKRRPVRFAVARRSRPSLQGWGQSQPEPDPRDREQEQQGRRSS